MPCAFTGGPYYKTTFLAANEILLVETLADALSRSGWLTSEKVAAWASAVPRTQPTPGTTVNVAGTVFTFVTTPSSGTNVQISSNLPTTCANFVAAVDAHTTLTATYDSSTGAIRVSYGTGGTAGNGAAMAGWVTWQADPSYSSPVNGLSMGGYKMKTHFVGSGSIPAAIPCVVYISQAFVFDWAWFTDGAGWPATGVTIQFMSVDERFLGMQHLMTSGPGAHMEFIGGPTHFYLFRTDVDSDPAGGVIMGGSYFLNYDVLHPPANAWWSMGDWIGSPFAASSSPRTAYGNAMANQPANRASECCSGTTYEGPVINDTAVTQLSLRLTPDNPGQFGGLMQPHVRYGGDPIISEPFLLSGKHYRGQFYDSLTVGKSFPAGFTGDQLAQTYPWSDGSTLLDGTPKNRLSPDFDQAKWENITDGFTYGALFVVTSRVPRPPGSSGVINYVYEGKA